MDQQQQVEQVAQPHIAICWSNAATTASITGVTAGTYTVTVSDANSVQLHQV